MTRWGHLDPLGSMREGRCWPLRNTPGKPRAVPANQLCAENSAFVFASTLGSRRQSGTGTPEVAP